jgi:hypothetical protein
MMVNDDGAWRCREHYASRLKYRTDGAGDIPTEEMSDE